MSLEAAARRLESFYRGELTDRLANLEGTFQGCDRVAAAQLCSGGQLDDSLIKAALVMKKVAGQINVVIHAVGILIALPRILERDERVEYLSLGAGNTGREFDLATDRRIAEFKFIRWRGGAETIRQNSLFKDFFGLAEAEGKRGRYLYVLGLTHPLRFFNGRRALSSVLSKNAAVAARYKELYGDVFTVVREYYNHRKERVEIVDLLERVPELADLPSEQGNTT